MCFEAFLILHFACINKMMQNTLNSAEKEKQ